MSKLFEKLIEIKNNVINPEIEVVADIDVNIVDDSITFKLSKFNIYSYEQYSYEDVQKLKSQLEPISFELFQVHTEADYDGFSEDANRLIDSFNFGNEEIIHVCKLSESEAKLLKLKEVYHCGELFIQYIHNNVYFNIDIDDLIKPLSSKSIASSIKELAQFYNKLLELVDDKERINYSSNQEDLSVDYFKLARKDSSNFNLLVEQFSKKADCIREDYFIFFRDHLNEFNHGIYQEGYNFNWNHYPLKFNFSLTTIHQYFDRSWSPIGFISKDQSLSGRAHREIFKSNNEGNAKQFFKYYLFSRIDLHTYDLNFSLIYTNGHANEIKYIDTKYFIFNKEGEVIGQISFDSIGDDLKPHFKRLLHNINFIINNLQSEEIK